jgi:dTDP-4-dehydrorhamnose 3,5-epimerase-like enzyme
MKEFNFKKRKLENKEIIFKKKKDFRGHLARIFCKKKYSNLIKNFSIKQINHTLTKKKRNY